MTDILSTSGRLVGLFPWLRGVFLLRGKVACYSANKFGLMPSAGVMHQEWKEVFVYYKRKRPPFFVFVSNLQFSFCANLRAILA